MIAIWDRKRRKRTERNEQAGKKQTYITNTDTQTPQRVLQLQTMECVFNYFLRLSPVYSILCCSAFFLANTYIRTHWDEKKTAVKSSFHHRHAMQKRDKGVNSPQCVCKFNFIFCTDCIKIFFFSTWLHTNVWTNEANLQQSHEL